MSWISRRSFAIGTTLLFLLLGGLWMARKNLSQYLIVRYLESRGVSVDFDLVQLTPSHIELKNLILDEKIRISHLKIQRGRGPKTFYGIHVLDFHAEQVDGPTLLALKKKLQPPEPNVTSSKETAQTLLRSCQDMSPLEIRGQLDAITWDELRWQVDAQLAHPASQNEFHFSSRGDNASLTSPSFQAQRLTHDLDLRALCSPSQIQIEAARLRATIDQFQTTGAPAVSGELNSELTKAALTLDDAELQWRGFIHGQRGEGAERLTFRIPQAELKGRTRWAESAEKLQLRFSARSLSLSKGWNALLAELRLEASSAMNPLLLPVQGEIEARGFRVTNEKGLAFVQNISGRGPWTWSERKIDGTFQLSDSSQTLQLKKLQTNFETDTGHWQIHFPPGSHLRLSDQTMNAVPMFKQKFPALGGRINVQGVLGRRQSNLDGHLRVQARDVAVTSEYGNFQGLQLDHDIFWPTWRSSAGCKLQIEELVAGPTFKKLNMTYQVHSLDSIHIDRTRFIYETALVSADKFEALPQQRQVKNLKVKVQGFPLQTLLAMALKDFVRAEGNLNGEVAVAFVGDTPTFQGILAANRPGWIRYRKTDSAPAPLIKLGDTPMSILDAYLYDFQYQTLAVDLETDKDYRMGLILRTLGRNPNYLRGKPLQLKVNLEQNLLAGIKAMMLSYDLPQKLKERIEKADE